MLEDADIGVGEEYKIGSIFLIEDLTLDEMRKLLGRSITHIFAKRTYRIDKI